MGSILLSAVLVSALALAGCSGTELDERSPLDEEGLQAIDFALGNAGFAPGDAVRITDVLGDRATIEVGGTYRVEGTWKLGSAPAAMLALWATNGRVQGKNRVRVTRGEGHYSFEITLVEAGDLHVSYYPDGDGSSFGGVYFGTGNGVYRGAYVPGPPAARR